MAITHAAGNNQNTSNNLQAYPFTAITPTAGVRLIVLGAITDTAANITIADDVGLTWEEFGDASYDSGANKIFGFISSVAAAVLTTVTVSCTGDAGSGVIMVLRQLGNVRATGPIRQMGTNQGAATTTPTVAFPLAVNPANAVFGFVANETITNANVTEPASWTEIIDVGHSTPTMGGEYAIRLTGETNSTITWGSTSGSDWGSIAVEIYEVNQPVIPRIMHHRNQLAGD